jgi:hypothetical protein
MYSIFSIDLVAVIRVPDTCSKSILEGLVVPGKVEVVGAPIQDPDPDVPTGLLNKAPGSGHWE